MKKLLSVLLVSVLLLTCIALGAVSVSAATSGDYEYYIIDGEAIISGVKSSISGDITIPSKLGGYPVTAIDYQAFYNCDKLTAVTIPNEVTIIVYCAFWDCDNLKRITIGSGVEAISLRAFADCPKLSTIIVAENNTAFTSVDGVLFDYAKKTLIWYPTGKTATHYVIPRGVTTISEGAFSDADSLTSIAIPKSVVTIDDYCENIKKVQYEGSKAERNAIPIADGYSFFANATWEYNQHIYHDYAAATCTKAKTCKVCGKTSGGKLGHKYTNACDTKCNRCSAKRSITHSYKTITKKATTTANGYTVKRCAVCKKETGKTTIYKASKISLSTTTYTYNGKVRKPSVTVKDSKGNKISSSNYTITYASGRKAVGTYKVTVKFKSKYSGTKTLYFKIKPAVAYKYTISGGKVTITNYIGSASKLTIPSKLNGYPVTAIGDCAFYNCTSLTAVIVPDSVTTIGAEAFASCSKLAKITLGKKVKTIGYSAFSGCAITSITIPDSVTTIESGAFAWCGNLKTITLGKGVKTIDNYENIAHSTLFNGCIKLTSVKVSSKNPYFTSVNGVLFNKKKTVLRICPPGKSGSYTVPKGVATISGFAFYGCEKLTSITISDSVKTIKGNAFSNCKKLKKLALGKGLKTFETRDDYYCTAFSQCSKLTSLTVSKNNPYFSAKNGVLFNKKKTALILCAPGKTGTYTIPNSVTTIKEGAFSSGNLKTLVIPTSVKTIETLFGDSMAKNVRYTGTRRQANKIKFILTRTFGGYYPPEEFSAWTKVELSSWRYTA